MTRLTLLTIVLFFVSCTGQSEKNSISDLKKEVMEIHDEVMPRMGDLRRTEKALREKAATDMDSSAVWIKAADEVKTANDNMMSWMRNFDPNFEGTEDEVRTYLEEQKTAIEKVRTDMLKSLENGDKILN